MEKTVIDQLRQIHGVKQAIKISSPFDIIVKIESNSRNHINSIVSRKINNMIFVRSVSVLCVKN